MNVKQMLMVGTLAASGSSSNLSVEPARKLVNTNGHDEVQNISKEAYKLIRTLDGRVQNCQGFFIGNNEPVMITSRYCAVKPGEPITLSNHKGDSFYPSLKQYSTKNNG